MPETIFHFKQFSIHQDISAMKVGTDGVLLGAWAHPTSAKKILDIGTGTGLLALMMAQKSSAKIIAIEIDEPSYMQANQNALISPWNENIEVKHISLQEFCKQTDIQFDFIISNPPFFADAAKAPNEARNNARHLDESLSIKELIQCVNKLLSIDGTFNVIFPYREGMLFYEQAMQNNLFCTHVTRVKTKPDKLEKRLLMRFSKSPQIIIENEIVLTDENNNVTRQYVELTKEYYLNLNIGGE